MESPQEVNSKRPDLVLPVNTSAMGVQDGLFLGTALSLQLSHKQQSTDTTLFADSALRTWVLLPIVLVMILVGLLRHYVTQLIDTPPKPQPLKAVREQCVENLEVSYSTH